ncbi:hypothetical protein BGY98DRAFT_1094167 [Russula aff. rugulosa BPL654]|nr:hypothetical protein BGY98DRAFT_1094167 [Russula aff. rugulosa BPL654]
MAYAAPVVARQMCGQYGCRLADPVSNAATTTPGSSTDANQRVAMLTDILSAIVQYLNYGNSNTPSDLPPTTTVVSAAQSSSTPPASDPTGTPRSVPTLKWFTEIAIPSPAPSGV